MKFLFYTEADRKIREEIKNLIKVRDLGPKKMRQIITEEEMLTRIRRNLPCDNYITINQLMENHGMRLRRRTS